MPTLASDIMVRVRAVLNDTAIDLYTDEVILPYLQIANDDLSDELVDNGATVTKEVTVDLPLSAGNTAPVLPSNLIVPIELYEKDAGQDDSYYKFVTQRDFLPNALPGRDLNVWVWRKQTILLVGAIGDKQIRIRYHRLILSITGSTSPVELTHALNYLAYHTAAILSEHIGQNLTKAQTLEAVATEKLNKLLKKEVKQNQARPVRRRPFRLNRYVTYTR